MIIVNCENLSTSRSLTLPRAAGLGKGGLCGGIFGVELPDDDLDLFESLSLVCRLSVGVPPGEDWAPADSDAESAVFKDGDAGG